MEYDGIVFFTLRCHRRWPKPYVENTGIIADHQGKGHSIATTPEF